MKANIKKRKEVENKLKEIYIAIDTIRATYNTYLNSNELDSVWNAQVAIDNIYTKVLKNNEYLEKKSNAR